jgi:hypothetical protein
MRPTRGVAAVLLALLAALAVFAHHELGDTSFRPSADAMPSMSASPAPPGNPVGAQAGAPAVLLGESSSSGAGHGTGTPACPHAAGQMCASGAVNGHFVPAVPAGADPPFVPPAAHGHRIVESAIGRAGPPGLPTVLRI